MGDNMKKKYWCGLREFRLKIFGKTITIWYLGKCLDGWKDFYDGLKPYKKLGYSNPIFCKSKNWGYDSLLHKYRIVFCLLWFGIQWDSNRRK